MAKYKTIEDRISNDVQMKGMYHMTPHVVCMTGSQGKIYDRLLALGDKDLMDMVCREISYNNKLIYIIDHHITDMSIIY